MIEPAKKIVIVGGSFAGSTAARELRTTARRPYVDPDQRGELPGFRSRVNAVIVLFLSVLCVPTVGPAFAKQKFQLSKCTHYSECMKDVRPYCKKDAAGEPAETRAAAYAACFARYESTCREVNCD
ncbi:MAG: hypothetical protein FWC84_03495 [Alphaproteobacteria bacterium]|nr:hypothetical protein [Alphaproteobacteria bacterium]